MELSTKDTLLHGGLQAKVYDPLFMIGMQGLVGEFKGDDGGSPIKARLRGSYHNLTRYNPGYATFINSPYWNSKKRYGVGEVTRYRGKFYKAVSNGNGSQSEIGPPSRPDLWLKIDRNNLDLLNWIPHKRYNVDAVVYLNRRFYRVIAKHYEGSNYPPSRPDLWEEIDRNNLDLLNWIPHKRYNVDAVVYLDRTFYRAFREHVILEGPPARPDLWQEIDKTDILANHPSLSYDSNKMPLETLVEREIIHSDNNRTDLGIAAESGLVFFKLLGILKQTYKEEYMLNYEWDSGLIDKLKEIGDSTTRRFLKIMIKNVPDGRKLFLDINQIDIDSDGKLRSLPTTISNFTKTEDIEKIKLVCTKWKAWYQSLFSEPKQTDEKLPWNSRRLEYEFLVSAPMKNQELCLKGKYGGGHLDSFSFDIMPGVSLGSGTTSDSFNENNWHSITRTVIPTPITVPGGPVQRFFEIEPAGTSIANIEAGPEDLSRILILEFAFIHGHDWFVIPIDLEVGSICNVDSLIVTDTFGFQTLIKSANFLHRGKGINTWAMYNLSLDENSNENLPDDLKDLFFFPPVLGGSLKGKPIEDVRFMRDEEAKKAWAIENIVESEIGKPLDRSKEIRIQHEKSKNQFSIPRTDYASNLGFMATRIENLIPGKLITHVITDYAILAGNPKIRIGIYKDKVNSSNIPGELLGQSNPTEIKKPGLIKVKLQKPIVVPDDRQIWVALAEEGGPAGRSDLWQETAHWDGNTKSYSVGEIIYHGGKLYRVITEHVSSQEDPPTRPDLWQETAHWDGNTKSYSVGEIIYHGGKLYRVITEHVSSPQGNNLSSRWFSKDDLNTITVKTSESVNDISQPLPSMYPGIVIEETQKKVFFALKIKDEPLAENIALEYALSTQVPENWIPMVPVRVNPADDNNPAIRLVRGKMPKYDKDGSEIEYVSSQGKILESDSSSNFQLYEEEIPRSGIQVKRHYQYARWMDGSTHLWIGRAKRTGTGPGSSGLRFDTINEI